jgi:hypothetical protein
MDHDLNNFEPDRDDAAGNLGENGSRVELGRWIALRQSGLINPRPMSGLPKGSMSERMGDL